MFKQSCAGLILLNLAVATTVFAEDVVNTDRYTLIKIDPTGDQKEPLTAIVSLSFGADIATVGEAIIEVLNGSGYRWEPRTDDQSLTTLPLPSVMRSLGPIRVQDALSTLAGQAWVINIDELHRVIWFDIKSTSSPAHF